MAIQNRRGLVADLDTTKMVAGEFAIPLDSKDVYVAFASGDTKRMATWEDFDTEIDAMQSTIDTELINMQGEIDVAVASANTATTNANIATSNANIATTNANTSAQACVDAVELLDDITANDILTKIKTVDGTGSGLDADLLDGQNGSYYSGWIGTFLTANKTVYVATTGSDTAGDGTSGKPYRTITKGLSMIPKNLNGFDATLNVASGIYAENVSVKGFNSGVFTIFLEGNVIVNAFAVSAAQFVLINSSIVTILTTTNTTITPFYIDYASTVRLSPSVTLIINTSNTLAGIYCRSLSNLSIERTAAIRNAKYAVRMQANCKVYINDLTGAGNEIGIQGEEGSSISYGTKTISATTDHSLSGGAIITNLITIP